MSKSTRVVTLAASSLAAVAEPGGVILLMLIGLVALYIWLAIPLGVAITGLLLLLAFACRQLSLAYPEGSGAYLMARAAWGQSAGHVVAATLLIDTVLTAAVGLSAAVDQIANLWPILFAYKVPIALVLLLLITYVQGRGLAVPISLLATPTYLFITTMLILIGVGFWQALNGSLGMLAAASSTVSGAMTQLSPFSGFIFAFLLLRTISTNLTVLPGLGATELAAPKPTALGVKATGGWDVALLLLFYLGSNLLGEWAQVQPTATEGLIAQLVHTVYDDPLLQFLTLAAVALLLLGVVYASFTNLPQVAALQAGDGCLPKRCLCPDKRLNFRWGRLVLAALAGCVLICFQGNSSHLFSFYAFNVFLHFTLAQLGLVNRFRRIGHLMQTGGLTPTHAMITLGTLFAYDPLWRFKLLLHGVVVCLTASVTVLLLINKFTAGVWVVVLLLVGMSWLFQRVQRHYQAVAQLLGQATEPLKPQG